MCCFLLHGRLKLNIIKKQKGTKKIIIKALKNTIHNLKNEKKNYDSEQRRRKLMDLIKLLSIQKNQSS